MTRHLFIWAFVILNILFFGWVAYHGGLDGYFPATFAKACNVPQVGDSADPVWQLGVGLVKTSAACSLIGPLYTFSRMSLAGFVILLLFSPVFYLIALMLSRIKLPYVGLLLGTMILLTPIISVAKIYQFNPCPYTKTDELAACQSIAYQALDHYYWLEMFKLANVDPAFRLSRDPSYNPWADLIKIKKSCDQVVYSLRRDECLLTMTTYANKLKSINH